MSTMFKKNFNLYEYTDERDLQEIRGKLKLYMITYPNEDENKIDELITEVIKCKEKSREATVTKMNMELKDLGACRYNIQSLILTYGTTNDILNFSIFGVIKILKIYVSDSKCNEFIFPRTLEYLEMINNSKSISYLKNLNELSKLVNIKLRGCFDNLVIEKKNELISIDIINYNDNPTQITLPNIGCIKLLNLSGNFNMTSMTIDEALNIDLINIPQLKDIYINVSNENKYDKKHIRLICGSFVNEEQHIEHVYLVGQSTTTFYSKDTDEWI